MIVGIGTDLCRISRMEKALASPAFFHRVFGPEEQALLERRTGAGRLATAAANFAAKEAFLKAAGVGLGGFRWATFRCFGRRAEPLFTI